MAPMKNPTNMIKADCLGRILNKNSVAKNPTEPTEIMGNSFKIELLECPKTLSDQINFQYSCNINCSSRDMTKNAENRNKPIPIGNIRSINNRIKIIIPENKSALENHEAGVLSDSNPTKLGQYKYSVLRTNTNATIKIINKGKKLNDTFNSFINLNQDHNTNRKKWR